jgi:hypothetical protein
MRGQGNGRAEEVHRKAGGMNERYWIAINGPSCALCAIPLCEPLVTPTPEYLIGLPKLEDAQDTYQLCLSAPMARVKRFIRALSADIKAGRITHVRLIRPEHPQPPTGEMTAWTESGEAHAMLQKSMIKESFN